MLLPPPDHSKQVSSCIHWEGCVGRASEAQQE